MPAVNLSPLFNDAQLDSSGNPYSGALLFTYAAGSSTKQNTYTSSAGTTAQANPIVLNARGEPASPIWLTDSQSYKFVLAGPSDTDPPASPIRTIDNIVGINDVTASSVSEWVASALTPTYVSATSFTLVGDQTTEFHVGRRIKATVTAGTVWATSRPPPTRRSRRSPCSSTPDRSIPAFRPSRSESIPPPTAPIRSRTTPLSAPF